jgi:hypothetical protein
MRFSTAAIAAIAVLCGPDHSATYRPVEAEAASTLADRRQIQGRTKNDLSSQSQRQTFQDKIDKIIIHEGVKPLWEQPSESRLEDEEGKERECDLDVGILKCEKHQICVPNLRSAYGGVCRSIQEYTSTSRELQPSYGNETATPFPTSTLDPDGGNLEQICETYSPPGATCNCSRIAMDGRTGEVTCSYDDPRCNYTNGTSFCGYVYTALQFDVDADSFSFQYCLTAEQEEFCYTTVSTYSNREPVECSATLNGCTCECLITGDVCDNTATEIYRFLFYCPDDLTSETCRNFDVFFGNEVATCDGTGDGAGTPSPGLPTLSPSDNNDGGGPTIDETMTPIDGPPGTAPSITTLTPVATLPPGLPETTAAPTLASSGSIRRSPQTTWQSVWLGSIVTGVIFHMLRM